MIDNAKPIETPFSSITSRETMEEYYRGQVGQAGRELFSGMPIEKERLARWMTPPSGLVHLLETTGSRLALGTICICEEEETGWVVWMKWEEEGYGKTLRQEMEKIQIEPSEKQWILNHLKRINQTLLRSFKNYQYEIPFHPHPTLLN